jgi:hypothetical protein
MQIVKIGGTILPVLCYALAFGYVFMLVEPTYYCVTRGCGGPGEGDIFFIPFIFGLGGVPVTVAALAHSIVQMKKKSRWAWLFRIFAVVFGTVLVSIGLIFAYAGVTSSFHR